ncbi:hypothetical protein DOTSEDRAFT_151802 [Dothistroma septosporum NZE10]|uniref:Uncharacterized protein n=1 Tax=Dothistroma septosporum (strain NZE10 / CBS 128990) TaxID=675120 RepID=N1PKW2_DOTSN|nr:hypothetical protein DOTSEDRAFT_151802 [Dothistroma septosporum NZE10]
MVAPNAHRGNSAAGVAEGSSSCAAGLMRLEPCRRRSKPVSTMAGLITPSTSHDDPFTTSPANGSQSVACRAQEPGGFFLLLLRHVARRTFSNPASLLLPPDQDDRTGQSAPTAGILHSRSSRPTSCRTLLKKEAS